MADTDAPAMGAMHDVLTLAAIERRTWDEQLHALRASGVPLLADGDGSGGQGSGEGGGDGDQGAGSGAASGAGGEGNGNGGGDDALGDAGKRALAVERDARKAAEKRAADAERKAKEFEDRDLTEQQKLEKRAAEAEGKVPTLEAENTRLRVALEKGLVGDRAFLADRLRGTTKEELTADADELLKQFGGGGTGRTTFDGGARGSAAPTDMDTLIRQKAGYA